MIKNPEFNSEHGDDKAPITGEYLNEFRQDLYDKISHIGKTDIAAADGLIEDGIQELLESSEDFQRIFTTDQGSIYFVANDGSSLRIKKKLPDGIDPERDGASVISFRLQNILTKQFFISKDTMEYLKSIPDGLDDWFDQPIPKADYKAGVCPIEFGLLNYPSRVVIEDDHDFFTIRRTEPDQGFSGGCHLGHPIEEIIK